MILIIAENGDATASAVADILSAKGAQTAVFATTDLPTSARLNLLLSDNSESYLLTTKGVTLDAGEVNVIWYRAAFAPRVPEGLSSADAAFARRESTQTIRSFWHLLRDRFWVNAWPAMIAADHKPFQLQVAKAVGLKIPKTLITNDPIKVRDFFIECSGHMVYKTLTPYQLLKSDPYDKWPFVFTNVVTQRQLDSSIATISNAPCIFQEYVSKRVELRVTAIGRQMFPVEIHSQEDESSRCDWRCASDPDKVAHCICTLPEAVRSKLLLLMDRLGLVFGCIDLIVTPDNQCVFLEVNSTGQWFWLQQRRGIPIAEHLAEMLMQRTPHYVMEKPASVFN